jgi:glycosyltransferase involved in cell wall biosynthesis
MLTLNVPDWVNRYNYPFHKYEDIPHEVFDKINELLNKKTCSEPEVSILITAWNEEVNILRSIASLAHMETKIPFEIIVVNNNSSDKTQETINALNVRALIENKQGCGPARQTGQEHARGKYILLADADSFYPAKWIDEMIKTLKQKDVVVVYGRYAFISEKGYSRIKLILIESMKNIIVEIRKFKRPFLNVYGLSMGYHAEKGKKVGFIRSNVRGSDGTMAYDLMQFGKIKQVKSSKAVIWTFPRTLQKDSNFYKALLNRIFKELARFPEYFHSKMKYHSPRE